MKLNKVELIQYLGLSLGIAFLLLGFILLFLFLKRKNKLKEIKIKSSKSKRKRRMQKELRKELEGSKKRAFRGALVLMIVSLVIFSATAYANYYIRMTLGKDDETVIVQSYFLLKDLEDQLTKAKDYPTEEKENYRKNIIYLASRLASYGVTTPSELNAKEGQQFLSNYYKSLSEIGQNVNDQASNALENPDLIDTFLTDISNVQKKQKKALNYYKVDEDALKSK